MLVNTETRTPSMFDFRRKMVDLPSQLTKYNATYTRNSSKNVVQDGVLVQLAANQFGTSYDPVTGLYGYVPETAATNLATNSDGAASTYTVSNVADGTAVTGFANGLAFGDNSVQRFAYKKVALTAAATYSVSVFVIMDDGNAPVVGTSTTTGDMRFVIDGFGVSSAALVERLGSSNVYRISASATAPTGGASRDCGVIKYTGQSARTFRVTGIQVETGLRATSYIATTGSTASRAADVLSVPLWVNNLLYSQDATQSAWTRNFCTVSTDGTVGPDGVRLAQLVTATSTTNVTCANTVVKAPAAVVTYQVKVKKKTKDTCTVRLRNHTTSTHFTTGTVTFSTGSISGAGWTIEALTDGWYLCKFTQATGISVGDTLYAYAIFNSGTFTAGDDGYFIDPQIEPGSTATSYRPTTSTLESAANANIPGFSSAGYTLFADGRMDVTAAGLTGGAAVSVFKDASNANYINRDSAGRISPYNLIGGTVVVYSNGDTASAARKKSGGTFTAANVDGAVNGAALTMAPDAPQLLTSPTLLYIGSISAFGQLNSYLFRVGPIPQALTQEQINGLTTL